MKIKNCVDRSGVVLVGFVFSEKIIDVFIVVLFKIGILKCEFDGCKYVFF